MSRIGCPCGNDVRQNDLDNVWLFVADSLMDELADSQAFFGLECRAGEKSEVWHCKECDRLIILDDDRKYVTRYMRRVSGGTPPVGPDAHRGVLYNEELFFDEVDEYLTEKADLRVACNREVAKASGMSTKMALRYIKALLDEGLLEPIGTKNSPKRRYRPS